MKRRGINLVGTISKSQNFRNAFHIFDSESGLIFLASASQFADLGVLVVATSRHSRVALLNCPAKGFGRALRVRPFPVLLTRCFLQLNSSLSHPLHPNHPISCHALTSLVPNSNFRYVVNMLSDILCRHLISTKVIDSDALIGVGCLCKIVSHVSCIRSSLKNLWWLLVAQVFFFPGDRS